MGGPPKGLYRELYNIGFRVKGFGFISKGVYRFSGSWFYIELLQAEGMWRNTKCPG